MPSRFSQPLLLGLLAALLEAAFLVLRRLDPFDHHAVEVIALGLGASIIHLFAVWLVLRWRDASRAALLVVVLAALAFRLTLFPLPPTLSPDLYRYQWEGKLQLAGQNSYLVAPEERQQLPGPGWTTAYGPLAELLFRLTAQLDGVTAFKLLSVLFDLGSLLVLLALLRARGQPAAHALLYAWCPLVVIEFAGIGHNDSAAVFALLLANFLIIRGRPSVSIVALAASVLTKWFAVPLLLVFFRRTGVRGLLLFAAAAGLAFLPFLDAGWSLFAGVSAYVQHWRNNASLFDLLRLVTGSDAAAGILTATALGGLALVLAAKRAEPLRASYLLLAVLLLLSPSVFPWYLTWLIPFLCFYPSAGFLLWTATIFLSYHVLIDYTALGTWHYDPWLVTLEYAPVFALLLWGMRRARR